MLVRPRVLSHAIVFTPETEKDVNNSRQIWWQLHAKDLDTHLYKDQESLINTFSDLSLGNTELDLSTCYTGVITHYQVNFRGMIHVIDKTSIEEFMVKMRKVYGSRANLKVSYVGLKIFTGMERDPITNELRAINPWKQTEEKIWFFRRKEIVLTDDIIRYESAHNGDLIIFPKAKGIVVKHKVLNKPKFFLTCSWTCKNLTLLNGNIEGYTRFLPDRTFIVRKPGDPLPEEMQDLPQLV